MKRKNKWIATTVLTALLLVGIPSMAMAQNVTVTLPTFPVTLNGSEMVPMYDEYPVLVYNGITYFPLTGYYGGYLGFSTTWADNTLTVQKVKGMTKNLRWYEKPEANKNTYTASVAPWKVVINGNTIQNSKEAYPLLQFRDITYFPLTWRFAVDEFGWYYSFDEKNGLIINSKSDLELNGKSQSYVISGDVAVGHPYNSYDDKYTFTYKKGDGEEKEFSLKSQLQGADYYFNHQSDENGYIQFDTHIKPSIEGDILILPCVRQDNIGKKENLILKIDFVKGTIISKTAI